MRSTFTLTIFRVTIVTFLCGVAFSQQQQQPVGNPEPVATVAPSNWGAPRIWIDPASGLQSYVAAAIVKKHVPAVVTQDQNNARFTLAGNIDRKTESTGSKIARCLFVYCIGIEGIQTVTVTLMDTPTGEVIWAYTVKKASANAFQSTAEAVAKHLKKFLEQRPM